MQTMILLKKFNRPQVGIYVLFAGFICFIGATILAVSQIWLLRWISVENLWGVNLIDGYMNRGEGASPSLFEVTVTGPVFETMILLVLLYILTNFIMNRLTICCISAVIWGVAHALINSPVNLLPSTLVFFVLSSSVFDWEEDISKQYFVPLGIHSLVNALAYFIL